MITKQEELKLKLIMELLRETETKEAKPDNRHRDEQGRFAKKEEEFPYRSEHEMRIVKRRGTYGTYDVKDNDPFTSGDMLFFTMIAFGGLMVLFAS